MPATIATLALPSPDATAALAAQIGALLRPGDTLGLVGPVGAGKSFFARALIQALQMAAGQPPEDVPSPTFTLIQSYEAGSQEIWHCDLYRLSDPSEALELGLDTALETAICLVEWPERLGADWPEARALTCTFDLTPMPEARQISLRGGAPWAMRLHEITR